MKNTSLKSKESAMTGTERILTKVGLTRGMSVNAAIVRSSEFIDTQTDPLKFSNAVLQALDIPIPYISEPNQAKTLALAAIEQLVIMEVFDPSKTAEIAISKYEKIKKKMPYAFGEGAVVISTARRGAKRDVARQIYLESKGMDEKDIIALVAKELDISPQNAYTYIYLIKKSLKV
jgi:hypothetical protein